ncbi:MAG: cation:proton antiporter [Deltaproteobacteria bacterium]|nr:cation:proton antiporter [Deltaproteobacteria bacterium]MBW2445388.1 cation:proton antiporter [Deltaproteobacteria bacterium]
MGEGDLLPQLLILIAVAAVGVAVFERLGLPAVTGFLLTGALVGPGGLGLIQDSDRVRDLAEFGVVFLLFEIGLELPVERLRGLWREAFLAGGLQVTLTVGVVAWIASASGMRGETALVVGALVAMSSTALVIRLLADQGAIDAPQGQVAVGILLFQDLCIVPFLLAVPLLANDVATAPSVFVASLAKAGATLVLFGGVAYFALPWLLDRVARQPSKDLFSLLALLVVVGSAFLAQEVGLTLAVGAFVAGLVTASSPYAHQLFAEVVSLRGVLLGLFFTAVGMLFDPAAAWAQGPEVMAYVAGVVGLKAGLVFLLVLGLLRLGVRVAVLAGLALAQTGEFSFVLAAAAGQAGLLDADVEQVFLAGSVLTLLATPFLLAAGPRIASALAAGSDKLPTGERRGAPRAGGHVVLVGFGLAGRSLARILRAIDIEYVAIETNVRTVREVGDQGEPIVFGDATRVPLLERVSVGTARLVIVAISDAHATHQVVRAVRGIAPNTPVLARTRYILEADALFAAGAQGVVADEFESTIDLGLKALRSFGIADSALSAFAEALREEGYEPLRASPDLRLDPWLTELLLEGRPASSEEGD